jgi:phage gp29-like protein
LKNLNSLNIVSHKGFSILANLSIHQVKRILQNGSLNEKMLLFQTMLSRDFQVIGDFRKVRIQIGALDYKIEGESLELVKFVEDIFDDLDFDSLLHDLTSAIGFGFANIELSWELKDGSWRPTDYQFFKQGIIHKEPITNRLYLFDDSGNRIFLDSNPSKYFSYIHKSNSGFIEDFGLFNSLVWAFIVTDFIYSNYLNFTDILGIPPVVAIGDTDKPAEVLEQILMLRDGNAGIFPKEFDIQLLESKGSGDHFLKAIEYIDKKKSNILLGGNLNSDSGSHGSQSLGEVQERSKDSILKFDTAILQRFLNRFIRKSLQFSKFANSEFKFVFEMEEPKSVAVEKIGDAENNSEKEFLDPIEEFSKNIDLKNIQKNISEQVANSLKNSNSKEEFLENIYSQFGDIEFSELENSLESAIFNAKVDGAVNW